MKIHRAKQYIHVIRVGFESELIKLYSVYFRSRNIVDSGDLNPHSRE